MTSEEQKKANRRLGLILASVALAFGIGFVAKLLLIGG
ncbi:cytochrome oxidase small assembly protein [Ramlibacter henchirensis]|nr:cytochrome oxidase small assembly protein [Ramlibacter henchirensis]